MIRLRQDVRQPADCQVAIRPALLQAVRPQMPPQHLLQVDMLGQPKNQRNVINTFMAKRQYVCHKDSLLNNSPLGQATYAKAQSS